MAGVPDILLTAPDSQTAILAQLLSHELVFQPAETLFGTPGDCQPFNRHYHQCTEVAWQAEKAWWQQAQANLHQTRLWWNVTYNLFRLETFHFHTILRIDNARRPIALDESNVTPS